MWEKFKMLIKNKFSETLNHKDKSVEYKEFKEPNIVREIVLSIHSLVESKDIGYNIFMELSIRLKDIGFDSNSDIVKVFEAALVKLDNEWTEKNSYQEEMPDGPETANDILRRGILHNSENGVTSIEWTMKDFMGEAITQKFEAYHIDAETWELLQLYIEDSKGNDEGYTYKCVLEPEISEIESPYCDCEYVSSTDTVQGNYINSNCDTWGTEYGSKAKGLYAFYISDFKKFAIVYESYWCC